MKNASKFLLTICYLFCFAPGAQAELYWGIGVISSSNWVQLNSLVADVPIPAGKFEYTNPGIKVYSGFKANDIFSIELEYKDQMEFGVGNIFNGEELWLKDKDRARIETKALLLSGQSRFNFDEGKYVFVRGGLYNWDINTTDLTFTDDLDLNRQGTDIFYAIGANFDFSSTFGIRAEWERFAVDDEDVDFISTELQFSF